MKKVLLLTCILFVSLGPLAVAQHLVGQWSFEGNLLDSSGNNNNGTATGTVGYAPGRFGQALDFTASGYVTIPNSPSLQTPNFTVAYWALLSSDENPDIANKRNAGDSESAWQVNISGDSNGQELQGCLFGGPPGELHIFRADFPKPGWTLDPRSRDLRRNNPERVR